MIALALKIITIWLLAGIAVGLRLGPILKDRSAAYPPVRDA